MGNSQNQSDDIELVSEEEMQNSNGDCFIKAIDTLTEAYLAGKEDEEWFITHALVQHPETGKYHWHAWNEVEKTYHVPYQAPGSEEIKTQPVRMHTVIDNSNGRQVEVPAGMYYNIGHVTCVKRYSVREAQDMMREHMHAGPWHEYVTPESGE